MKIQVIPPDPDHKSAPIYTYERAVAYLADKDLQEDDQVWLVMDTDDWSDAQLMEVERACSDKGWHLAISNPCFEVWLYLHYDDLPTDFSGDCKAMKSLLHQVVQGGYSPETAIPNLAAAITRAENLLADTPDRLPGPLQTQLHLLAKAIQPFLQED